MPFTRLYTQDASRDARKAMLECRNSDFAKSKCRMIVAGTVQTCIRNKGQLNEVQIPCITITEAFVLPEEWTAAAPNDAEVKSATAGKDVTDERCLVGFRPRQPIAS